MFDPTYALNGSRYDPHAFNEDEYAIDPHSLDEKIPHSKNKIYQAEVIYSLAMSTIPLYTGIINHQGF